MYRVLMKSAAVIAAIVLASETQGTRAWGDTNESWFDIAYVEPADPALHPVYERLRQRKVLEELRLFLSPLVLPEKALIKTDQCNGKLRIPYESGQPVVICYEYVVRIGELAPAVATPSGVSREQALIGAFAQLALHKVAFLIFDVFEIPVWGREEDAADKLAAYVMLQFDEALAIRTIKGAVWFFEAFNQTWTGSDFARETSPELQRFYNFLCMAYGGRTETFRQIVGDTLLKTRRAENCPHEFREERYAFRKLILPHLDPQRLAEVMAMQWATAQ